MRIIILVVAFLGWFFCGMQIAITNLGMRDAAIDLMHLAGMLDLTHFLELKKLSPEQLTANLNSNAQLSQWNGLAAKWYARYQVAFLFGAASGGFLFGLLGDRIGRSRALAASIIFFSFFTGVSYFVQTPMQLLAGVGMRSWVDGHVPYVASDCVVFQAKLPHCTHWA